MKNLSNNLFLNILSGILVGWGFGIVVTTSDQFWLGIGIFMMIWGNNIFLFRKINSITKVMIDVSNELERLMVINKW